MKLEHYEDPDHNFKERMYELYGVIEGVHYWMRPMTSPTGKIFKLKIQKWEPLSSYGEQHD